MRKTNRVESESLEEVDELLSLMNMSINNFSTPSLAISLFTCRCAGENVVLIAMHRLNLIFNLSHYLTVQWRAFKIQLIHSRC
jgi:hypothetical protein